MESKSDYTLIRSVMDVIEFLLSCLFIIIKSIVLFFLPESFQHRKKLEQEIALITGGGSGLGRLVALRLARLGVVVVLWDINYEGKSEPNLSLFFIKFQLLAYTCIEISDEIFRFFASSS